jgi:magnesium chelatase subunit I
VSDIFEALPASSSGKIEIESLTEGKEEQIMEDIIKHSVQTVYRRRSLGEKVRGLIEAIENGHVVHTGSDVASTDFGSLLIEVPELRTAILELTGGQESPDLVASAVEFLLEGLWVTKRINKDESGTRATYRARA